MNFLNVHNKIIIGYSQLIKPNLPKYIFSHLGASEDLDEKKYTEKQIKEFISIDKALENKLTTPLKKHLLNTSGILNFSEYQFDMVRSGIGLYGFGNDIKYENNLKPVLSLKTIISQIHEIKAGSSVGYNKGFTAKANSVIATLPIGHADGIGRQYGNKKGEVLLGDKMAKIVGNVCMDMLMIDVTEIKCKEGDEVVFFDDNSYSAEEFSKKDNVEIINITKMTSTFLYLSKNFKKGKNFISFSYTSFISYPYLRLLIKSLKSLNFIFDCSEF